MGLDMYLTKKTYVKNWSHQKPEEKHVITITKNGKPYPKEELDLDKVSEVVEEVAYWRKANAIHQWFVNNVQGGEDNCKEYYVSTEDLKELVDICEQVLANSQLVKAKITNGAHMTADGWEPIIEDGESIKNPSMAAELLPTSSGFFFGSTDYDEYYYEDIKNTIEQLKPYTDKETKGSFYYQASW